jgi:hypothetical protein
MHHDGNDVTWRSRGSPGMHLYGTAWRRRLPQAAGSASRPGPTSYSVTSADATSGRPDPRGPRHGNGAATCRPSLGTGRVARRRAPATSPPRLAQR